MARTTVEVADNLLKDFRLEVGKRKGVQRGAMKEAMEEALTLWLRHPSLIQEKGGE
jgi:hypothetical protein